MNPMIAFSPLLVHIPHAVPVVIVWGIMLRFYLVARKQKQGGPGPGLDTPETDPATRSPNVRQAADRPVARRVWAADDELSTDVASDRHDAPVPGRTPVGRL
ncbi:MAG TPA: hypothetical protein VG165_17235 [Solirubrobacteraceae bacterium]|jgi:hypothetical protein|nr:hypothetical protein [Solirubrobacteraceae bacterium]